MTAELGVFFLILALLLALLQTTYLFPHKTLRIIIARIIPIAVWLQAFAVVMALVVLITLRLDSDFTVTNVVNHSNLSLPTLYKIVGSWGNHEGSMLLWALVLTLFGAILTSAGGALRLYAGAVQSALSVGILLFILFTSNPFSRVFPPMMDGKTLNPLLQDIGLSIHPPLLYLGYVGFSVVFSLAVAALIEGRAGRDWAQVAHSWIMAAWSFLTLGIGLGSWWAYRELGWGGWWFWDPVENASLLPWLSGTALLHSNIVLKKRGMLGQWVILLSIITFALSLLGTFLVRSGIITSVHSFASDPERGVFILAYIFVTIGGALFLYALRGGKITSEGSMQPISREGFIVINNLFILSACATVLLGTLYPIFSEISGGGSITVGAPFFNITFIPLMAFPLIMAAITPFIAWKKANLRETLRSMQPVLIATLAAIFLILAFVHNQILAAVCGFGLAAWLGFSSLWWLRSQNMKGKYYVFLGHFGAAIMVFAITASSLWKEEQQMLAKQGDSLEIAGYSVSYASSKDVTGENYTAKQIELDVKDKGGFVASLFPQYRTYNISTATTSETAIYHAISGDLYAAIGENTKDGKTAIRLYFQPMINFLWLGFVLMALGGILSALFNRKPIQEAKI